MLRLIALLAVLGTPLVAQPQTVTGTGATLRALDKVSGAVADFTLSNGGQARMGRLVVTLGECRYPPDDQQGEAFAWITVREEAEQIFAGWMVGSSPALNALDHSRYDVWVLRCSSS